MSPRFRTLLTTHNIRDGFREMHHPRLGHLLLSRADSGWFAHTPGLDGKVVASAKTLRELRKWLEWKK